MDYLKNYKDPYGLGVTGKKLKFGLWILQNKLKFFKMVVIFLTTISLITWFFSTYNLVGYFILGKIQEDLAMSQLSQKDLSHEDNLKGSPKPIIVGGSQIIQAGEKYDFLAEAENPNLNYWSEFSYYFLINNDRKTESKKGFVLPGEKKHLVLQGQNLTGGRESIQIEIANLRWERVDNRQIPDFNEFKRWRINLETKELIYTPARATGLSGKLSVSALEFKVKNQTAFSYLSFPVTILLKDNYDTIVGVSQYSLLKFQSEEERKVELSFPYEIDSVSKIIIEPNINLNQDGIYIKL